MSEALLANYPYFTADQLDKVRNALRDNLQETLYVSDNDQDLNMSRVMLTYFDIYGANSNSTCQTDSEPLTAFHFVYVLKGTLVCDGELITNSQFICFNPRERMNLELGGTDNDYLILRLKNKTLVETCRQLYDVSAPEEIKFPRFISTIAGAGRTLSTMLESMVIEISDDNSLFSQGITTRQTEELFLVALLHNAENFSGKSQRFLPLRNASLALKKTINYIRENLANDIELEQLVTVSGVSKRSLQAEFSRHLGLGPIGYIKQLRLQSIRQQLTSSQANKETITNIAAYWGFTNPSNFASLYRKEFGELPSQTVKRMKKETSLHPNP